MTDLSLSGFLEPCGQPSNVLLKEVLCCSNIMVSLLSVLIGDEHTELSSHAGRRWSRFLPDQVEYPQSLAGTFQDGGSQPSGEFVPGFSNLEDALLNC